MPAPFRHRLESMLLRSVVRATGWLSWSALGALGRGLGDLAFHVLRIRRRVTLENLARAFPDWDEKRRRRVARDCYRHFGVTFLELLRLPGLGREEIAARVSLEGEEHLDAAVRSGRGAAIATGHLGNWELLGAAATRADRPLWVAVKTQRNLEVDRFVTGARERAGLHVLRVEEGARRMATLLRRGGLLTLLVDQDAGRSGIFLPFLGRPASTAVGIVRLARLAACPILTGYSLRQPDGRYVGRIEEPIRIREDLPADEAEREALGRVVDRLEAIVRRHPEQWFWMHRRWKTRPPEEGGEAREAG